MKTAELKEHGLTEEQIAFVMAENGKDVTKLQKSVEDITVERDKYKKQAEEASKALEGFDGVNVDQLKADIEAFKKKAEDAEKEYSEKLYKRDFDDALRAALDGIEFTSEAAKKSVANEIREAGLKLKDGKILGLNDLVESIKAADKTAFVDKAQQNLENNKAKFTDAQNKSGGGNTITKESIMAIKDRGERRKLMSEHMDLFESNGGN